MFGSAHAGARTLSSISATSMLMRLTLLIALASSSNALRHGCRVSPPPRMMAASEPTTTSDFFADLQDALGIYSFTHPGGEFEVHLRDKGRFWAPRFQCASTWQMDSDGGLKIDFAQYGKYELRKEDDGGYSGSAVGKQESWRKMAKTRDFSAAELAVMDSKWEFEHAGGSFEVEFRADAFNHFVCEDYPAHSHWYLEKAETPTPTLCINWGKFGEYELEIAADGKSASGSVKGKPDEWRKMTNKGALGSNLKQYAEHNH